MEFITENPAGISVEGGRSGPILPIVVYANPPITALRIIKPPIAIHSQAVIVMPVGLFVSASSILGPSCLRDLTLAATGPTGGRMPQRALFQRLRVGRAVRAQPGYVSATTTMTPH